MKKKITLVNILIVMITVMFINACTKDKIEDQSNILYGIKHGDLYGYINSKGDIVLDNLNEGLLGELRGEKTYVYKVEYRYTYKDGVRSRIMLPCVNWKCYFRNGTVLDISGDYRPSIGQIYEVSASDMYSFSEDIAIVGKYVGGRYRYGFVDENAIEVIPCQYKWVSRFSDGLAAVYDTITNKIGFIDKQGNYVIQPQYSDSPYSGFNCGFNEGKAIVIGENGYKVIDINNKVVLDLADFKDYSYWQPGKVSDGLIRLRKNGTSTYGFINLSGEWVIQPTLNYEEVGDFVDGLAKVKRDNTYSYIDKSGNLFGKFHSASDFDENGLAWVSSYDLNEGPISGMGMFIDKTGNKAFPGEFAGYYDCSFVNGLALVYDRSMSKWKYINTSGETVLIAPGKPYTLSYTFPWLIFHGNMSSEGVAFMIFDDETWGYINKSGTIIWRSTELVSQIDDELLYRYN